MARFDRWVLFGEPGSGKSTVFEQAAAAEETRTVTARAFVEGRQPPGKVVFIDALEEYRISEPGRDRLVQLVEAIKAGPYKQWRITCRAASLPPADLAYMAKELAEFGTWQLGFLDVAEQKAILHSIGEPDPAGFIRKITDMAAGSLLGNPATLKLLHATALEATVPIHTRGALLAEATRLMAAEIDETLPERPGRPTDGAIIAAAEKACLVLVLSARNEIWIDRSAPSGDRFVTKDDLLPAEIDTEALRYALDTPMFRGEGGSFMPTHRIVAEYLAGRALAAAVSNLDGRSAALPLERAIALLSGDEGKPAPALVGTFAWFVAELSKGVHSARALKLVIETPEAILLQGDAAMLPEKHRLALLKTTGRKDPWFLSGIRGSTAVGGLAGDDLRVPFETILDDTGDTPHRRAMVLDALAAGRPMPAMVPAVRRFIVDPANPYWLRREALTTIQAIATNPNAELRAIFKSLRALSDEGSVLAQVKALSMLVQVDATGDEVRKVLANYSASSGSMMGYARSLADAIESSPVAGLFDKAMPVKQGVGRSRAVEVEGIIQRALAAAIANTPALSATDLLRWLGNTKLKSYIDPEENVHAAIAGWLAAGVGRSNALFWALHRQSHGEAWRAPFEYQRITGHEPSRSICDQVLDDLAAIPKDRADHSAVELARQLVGTGSEPDLYWRLWDLLDARTGAEMIFERFTSSTVDDWRMEETKRKTKNAAERAKHVAADRKWLKVNEADVRSGVAVNWLAAAAEMYAGHWNHLTKGKGFERVVTWAGKDLAAAITDGWGAVVTAYPGTTEDQAKREVKREAKGSSDRKHYIAAVLVHHWLQIGIIDVTLPLPAAFAALDGANIFNDVEPREPVRSAVIKAVAAAPDGIQALIDYWSVMAERNKSLPYAYLFENEPTAGAAAEALLQSKPSRHPLVLRSALVLVAKTLPVTRLKAVIESALKARLSKDARAIWTFVAFWVDPRAHEDAFKKTLSGANAHALFGPFHNDYVISAFAPLTEAAITRDAAIIRNLAPLYPPTDSLADHRDHMSQAVAGAIKAIASSPTREATEALEAMVAESSLKNWDELLRHSLEAQRRLYREAEFKPPKPIDVARALRAGPPATPADLRSVIREILGDLADDIRNGDTAGWRGFWNYPNETKRRPKIENDCRDLLTDRIRDRLIRFGVGAKRTFAEARSIDDRRIDLLIIGEGAAALPLEAKRHTNKEIWTAPSVQLDPYSRSAGSSGHGIYLVFWFGVEAGGVPKTPKGLARITTAKALRKAIIDTLNPEQKIKLDVVVFDVSPPKVEDEIPETIGAKSFRDKKAEAKVATELGS